MKSVLLNSKSVQVRRLVEISERHPDLIPAVTREMALRAHRYVKGIKLYQNHPAQRPGELSSILWQRGSTKLRDFTSSRSEAPIVFVVPSLINRFSILDLASDHSFLNALLARGLRPLVIDWDSPSGEEEKFALEDYVLQRLVPALRMAAGPRRVHLVGYCMGGMLALALAQHLPGQVHSLSLLATPWDFHAGYDATHQDGRALEEKLKFWLRADKSIPVDVVHNVFTSFQPFHALHKFSTFAEWVPESFQSRLFTLTEDWLNDGVPLTARTGRDCFGSLASSNASAKGQWLVGDMRVDPTSVCSPSFVVVPGRDKIVPAQSALPLARLIPGAVLHEPMMGHIGIMASPQAPRQVWQPLIDWIAQV